MKTLIAALLLLLTSGVHPTAIGDAPLLLTFMAYREGGDKYGGDIYLYDVEQQTLRRMTSPHNSARELEASIAPDRKHIVWTAGNGTTYQIEVAQLEENGFFGDALLDNPAIILNYWHFDSPIWSPCMHENTGQIAYVADWSKANFSWQTDSEIYIQDIPLRPWTEAELIDQTVPYNSPTTSPLALASAATRRRITDNDTLESDLAWSPDGKQIAYVSDISGSPEIYIQDTDGINKNIQQLTSNEWDERDPSWSSDGKWLVFSQRGAIHKMPIGLGLSGKLTNFNSTSGRIPTSPVWSPDDRYIAFEFMGEIYMMLSDGSELQEISPVGGMIGGYPAWVPLPREC